MKDETTIVLGVTGSIAAYKAAALVRLLRVAGSDVHVVMTEAATRFVGTLTFRTLSQNPVCVGMFDEPAEWKPRHIALADRAQAVVVAPCTANVMAKMVHGLADDLLTATLLASRAPIVVAPAMNAHMWDHPATRANMAVLKQRGVTVLDVEEGDLACGYEGRGRMTSPESIVTAVKELLSGSGRSE